MKPIELDPSRHNMKARPSGLTDEQYLLVALKEGYALLEAESKPPKATPSKPIDPALKPVTLPAPSKVQDALGKNSTNPYVRARSETLSKLTPASRSVIERMEAGEIPKGKQYDMFIKAVTELGDKYSGLN